MPTDGLLFQEKLTNNAAPTLCAIKIASLFSINKTEIQNYQACIKYFNQYLHNFRLHMMILKNTGDRFLIYVYRYDQLHELLQRNQVKDVLHSLGYPLETVPQTLGILKRKINSHQFPHEIGLFLGYPLDDVIHFMKREEAIYIGYWKVYGHLRNALKTFNKYDCAKTYLKYKLSQECELVDVLI